MSIIDFPAPVHPASDLFRLAALRLLDIAQDYRASGHFINEAAAACHDGKSAALYNALANIRAHAKRMKDMAIEIETQLDAFSADDIDDCPTVYAP